MNQERIGKFIAELRKEKGWTQEEFGEILGVSSKTISRWENGNYMPDISILENICNELGITVSEFLKGERIKEEEIITESNKNILDLLENKKREKRKYKKFLFTGIIFLVILLVLCINQAVSLTRMKNIDNDDEDTLIWFKDGVYINNQGVEITPFGSLVLSHYGFKTEDKREVSEEVYQSYLNQYYATLEIIHYYGYILLTDKTDQKTFIGNDEIRVRKLTGKMWPLLAPAMEEVEGDEYYCFLGFSKYGTYILSKYEDNKCTLDNDICEWLKQDGTKSEFDINNGYCQ